MKIARADGIKTVTSVRIAVGNLPRRVTRIVGMVDGQTRTLARFVPPLSVTLSPLSVSGSQRSDTATPVQTASMLATPAGGLAPFTYIWTIGSPGVVLSPGSARTGFRHPSVQPFETEFLAVTVTVTDAIGATATASGSAEFNVYSDQVPQ